MSYQNIKSDLLVELSADQQELLSGGGGKNRIICYDWDEDRGGGGSSTAGTGGSGTGGSGTGGPGGDVSQEGYGVSRRRRSRR